LIIQLNAPPRRSLPRGGDDGFIYRYRRLPVRAESAQRRPFAKLEIQRPRSGPAREALVSGVGKRTGLDTVHPHILRLSSEDVLADQATDIRLLQD